MTEIIGTVPPPNHDQLHTVERIVGDSYIAAVRFNTGAHSNMPYGTEPAQVLSELLNICARHGKELWVDLKGRQLRITATDNVRYHPVVLNHPVAVDLPAKMVFRNGVGDGFELPIKSVDGRKVFVDTGSRDFGVGNGQSVNIRGSNLRISGYLTELDKAYIAAARELGIKNFMLSFVEQVSDLRYIRSAIPDAKLVLKIESGKGLSFVSDPRYAGLISECNLMVARDDLATNLANPAKIFAITRRFLGIDRRTIVASRILTSLIRSLRPSIGDLADLELLKQSGCHRLMLCDDLCCSGGFDDAMDILARWCDE